MAKVSWFSEEGDELVFGRYVERLDSWKEALADGVVTVDEVRLQAERVVDLLRDLEDKLDDDLHEEVTTVFLEWAVLQGLESMLLLHEQAAGPSGSVG